MFLNITYVTNYIICAFIYFYRMNIPCHGGQNEVSFAAKTYLNILSGRHVIGQYETMHSCLNLPLTLCSEDLVQVRKLDGNNYG